MQELAVTKFFDDNEVLVVQDAKGDVHVAVTGLFKSLGYADPRDASKKWVKSEERQPLENVNSSVAGTATPPQDLDALQRGRWMSNFKSQSTISLRVCLRVLMQCQAPKAEPFQEWLLDVVESIQKTGSYSLKPVKPKSALDLAREQVILLETIENATRQLARLDYFSLNQLKTMHPWLVDVIHWRDLDRYAELLGLPPQDYGTEGVHTQAKTKLWHTDVLEAAAKDATRWRPHVNPNTLEFNWHELQGVRVGAIAPLI